MKALTLTLALAVFLVLAFGVAAVLGTLGAEEARHREAMHLIDEQQAAFDLARAAQRALATQDARTTAETLSYAGQGAIALLLPAGLVVVAILMVVEYRRRARYVWPRSDGLLPVPREQLSAVAAPALAGFHQARMIAAQGAPHNLTIKEVPQVQQSALSSQHSTLGSRPSPAPTFAQLLAVEPDLQEGFILGYANGRPISGSWNDLYSSAVSGLSGSGKTTTLRFLACQAALHDARFVLLDPHMHAGEDSLAGTLAPLAARFVGTPAGTPGAMLAQLQGVADVMAGRLNGAPADFTLVLVVDEFTSLMGRSDVGPALAQVIEAVAQEGRKVQVYALISGQIWTADRAGGTALRDALASAYVHRMRPEQARRLLPSADARRAGELSPGRALLARTSGEVVEVSIPKTTAEDVARVAQILATKAATLRLQPRAAEVAAEKPQVAGVAVDSEAIRAANLFLGGMTFSEIVAEMRGIKSNEGARYQNALGEIQKLARAGVTARLRE